MRHVTRELFRTLPAASGAIMPNWCDNWCLLSHDEPAMVARAHAAFLRKPCDFLADFIPIPQALDIPAKQSSHSSAEQLANEAVFGVRDWYDFVQVNWGTVKDLFKPVAKLAEDGKSLTVRFDSAWSPPLAAYTRLERLYGFRIEAFFSEPDMNIAGEYVNGQERRFDVGKAANADELAAMLPREMDRLLGVSKQRRKRDAENDAAE